MQWEDEPPRKGIDFGAAVGVPGGPTLFRVCILSVPEADPLPPAFAEFWRRVLTKGPAGCTGRWEVLLIQLNLLGGGFTCVFTDRDLERDEPPVFKLQSGALEAECYALPSREPGDPRAGEEEGALEAKCLALVRQALRSEPVAGALRDLRARHPFDVEVTGFYRSPRLVLDL